MDKHLHIISFEFYFIFFDDDEPRNTKHKMTELDQQKSTNEIATGKKKDSRRISAAKLAMKSFK
jgi:hypothetical protein